MGRTVGDLISLQGPGPPCGLGGTDLGMGEVLNAQSTCPAWRGPTGGGCPSAKSTSPCPSREARSRAHLGSSWGSRAAAASASVAETTVPSGPQGLQAWTAGGASCGTSPQPAGHGHFALQKSEPAFTRDRSSPQRDAKPVSSRLSFSSDAAAGCDKGA